MPQLKVMFKDNVVSIYRKPDHDWVFDNKERMLYIHYLNDNKRLIAITRIPYEAILYAYETFKDDDTHAN